MTLVAEALDTPSTGRPNGAVEQNYTRIFVVALGGALGSALRYVVSTELAARVGTAYPWATTTVNLVGAFVFGVVWSASEASLSAPLIRLFVLTGMMGGLTTFSTLAFEIADALFNQRVAAALVHTVVHVGAGVFAVWLGLGLGRVLLRVVSS
jgi:fluoride exporter